MPFGEHSIPLPNSFDFLHSEDTIRSGLLESQEPIDLWDKQTLCVVGGQRGTIEDDFWRNSVDVGTIIPHCSPNDENIVALWETFQSEEVITAPMSGSPTSLPLDLETDRPELPLHPQEFLLGDMSSLAEKIHVKHSNLVAGHEQRSTNPADV